MRAWRTLCPAKVNLFLAVGPPDPRGYHPLRTIFQAISLYDELKVRTSDSDQVIVHGAELPSENTLTKTLRLVRELLPVPPLEIHLTKEIPSEAGLGGGSSDAAGLIRILKRMLPDDFPDHFAFEVAEAVGADVPFFLVGGRARGEGYGQILEAIPDFCSEWYVAAKPASGSSTKDAYQKLDEKSREWRDFPFLDAEEPYNDFERVASCASLELGERMQIHGCAWSLLSGSGSSIFGLASDEEDAEIIASKLRKEDYWAASVRTLTPEECLIVEEHTWIS